MLRVPITVLNEIVTTGKPAVRAALAGTWVLGM